MENSIDIINKRFDELEALIRKGLVEKKNEFVSSTEFFSRWGVGRTRLNAFITKGLITVKDYGGNYRLYRWAKDEYIPQ